MADAPGGRQVQKRKRGDQEHIRHRTIRACLPCRRRKIKCNGARPYCRNCLRLNDECKWSGNDPARVVLCEEDHESLVTESQHRVLTDLFFSVPHLSVMRQSIHRPSFESTNIQDHPPFLLASIYCLSALYISVVDSLDAFNGESALNLSDRLAISAQKFSRDTSDQPTVSSTQANLILGFRELLCHTGYKAWMYIGIALRMSQALRLGREYHQRHSVREQEVRRRTLWTCFIMDRLSSVFCSRPQTLYTAKLRCFLPSCQDSFFFEESPPSRRSLIDSGPDPDCQEVYPFFIKAIEYWSVLADIFALGLQGPPSAPTDCNSDFYKAEKAIKTWKENLPSRMQWSIKNYKTHRLLGQGSMFVEFHFILNHALCVAHQEYLPEYEGDSGFESPSPQAVLSGDESVVKTCLHHADEITEMVSVLFSGDDTDRQLLHGPFVGLALETAACCHLWRIFRMTQSSSYHSEDPQKASTAEKLALICKVLKSWEGLWPVAAAWSETIELLSRLYEAAHPQGMLDFDLNRLDSREERGDISVGSGQPDPRNINTRRMFDNVRLIIMTASDPSSLRHHQTRLHIQSLWTKMFMQQEMESVNSTQLGRAVSQEIPSSYNGISNFDDMLDFMDDFEGLPRTQSNSITVSSPAPTNPRHLSPFP
ncbi:hypothetical protein EG329_011389 [Mollisiaceae sp. DMI_Dod_QoI]|nr:hypothetical protein EG329_011389 [Helotiales sp. DMI_Dod_QoI]